MRYFLDDQEVTLEELNEEQIKWEEEEFGPYENFIGLGAILDGKMLFYRYQFQED